MVNHSIFIDEKEYKVQSYTRGGKDSPSLLILVDVATGVRYTPYAQKRYGMHLSFKNLLEVVYGPLFGGMLRDEMQTNSWFSKIAKDDSWKGGTIKIPLQLLPEEEHDDK